MAHAYRVTNCWFVNIREQPDPETAIARHDVPRGTRLDATGAEPTVLEDGNVWLQVRDENGLIGWVNRKFLDQMEVPNGTRSGVLSVAELYQLVHRHGAAPGVDRIMVAAALTESGGDPMARGDLDTSGVWHARGLWQLHDGGSGAGMSVEERCDADRACQQMVPEFTREFEDWRNRGHTEEDLAIRTYLWAERPFDYTNVECTAGRSFLSHWPDATD